MGERGRRAGKVVLRLWDLESIEAGGSLGGGGWRGQGVLFSCIALVLRPSSEPCNTETDHVGFSPTRQDITCTTREAP